MQSVPSVLVLWPMLLLLSAGAVCAQTPGIPPEWQVRKDLAALAQHTQAITPILDQARPQEWVSQGAPAAYADQAKRVRAEVDYLIGSAKTLSQQPEKLTAALETYFRLQSVDAMLRSFGAGIRKYQNAALADLLTGAIASVVRDREKLREYIVELAADQEKEFKVVDQEAQRCRALLSRQPREASAAGKGKKERQ